MPSSTATQHRAMAAACKGRGRLGIPKDVGCEFMHADGRKTKHRKGKRARKTQH